MQMIERFRIYNREYPIGILEYNKITDKFSAKLIDDTKGWPPVLFGIKEPVYEVDDWRFRYYMSNCVMPPTRENVDDILREIGAPGYDPWYIYKYNKGTNWNDYAHIEPMELDEEF